MGAARTPRCHRRSVPQMEDLGLDTVTLPAEQRSPPPTFSGPFQQQVGGFFILANFQRFLETAYRALRHLARL